MSVDGKYATNIKLILLLTVASVFLEKRLNKGLWSEFISVPKYFVPPIVSMFFFARDRIRLGLG